MDFADHALVRRWQAGEPAAFEALVRRWERPVGRFLARYTLRPDIDDAVQEVFLRVLRGGKSYRPESAFSTWLFQIALNVARDLYRRRRPDALPLASAEPVDEVEPFAAYQTRETTEAVTKALAQLPDHLRLVLLLRHYEGLSFEEIGRVSGLPASTCKSRFAAALARLRPVLRTLLPDVR